MDDLTTKRSFESQTTWVIDILGKNILKCYLWMCIQPGIGGRPVDCCMNEMSVLYLLRRALDITSDHAFTEESSNTYRVKRLKIEILQ